MLTNTNKSTQNIFYYFSNRQAPIYNKCPVIFFYSLTIHRSEFICYLNKIQCIRLASLATNLSAMEKSCLTHSHLFLYWMVCCYSINILKFVYYKYWCVNELLRCCCEQSDKFIERLRLRNWFVLFVRWIDITNLRTQLMTALMNMCKLSKYYVWTQNRPNEN